MPDKPLSPLKQALVALDEMQARLDAAERERREPIAIVGLGCRFPGDADSPEAFWQLLRNGVDAVAEVPKDRFDADAYYDPNPDAPGKISTRQGSFLRNVYHFDPQFFGISPREAASMDPQQRLLLEVAWEALEHAGVAPDSLSGSATGVFLGICRSDYTSLQLESGDPGRLDLYYASGQAHSVAAGRVSYVLGLQGPSIALDTACSSSLVALHLAVESLRRRECDLALAAGVNLILSPANGIAFSKARMLAADGRCKTFDASGDGFGEGEGVAVLVLKRLSDTRDRGERVLALVRGTAVNQDGPSSGLTAPNGPSQQAVIRAALAAAGLPPARVSYVEAHGTGTTLGDPIEVQALAAVLAEGRPADRPVAIGSVKTNFGHLEATAGVAGVAKVVLALQHREIPPHLHLRERNPHIPWEELPVVVPTVLTPWPQTGAPRVAGVSSFGFSGTNAHVVLEEAPPLPSVATPAAERPLHLLALSARTDAALRDLAGRYAEHVGDEASLADFCFTAATGRAQLSHRAALAAATPDAARAALRALATGEEAPALSKGPALGPARPKVAFLFTGQGSQYAGMARQLYETQPTFRQAMDRCADLLAPRLAKPLLEVIFGAEASLLDETAYTQPALFALEWSVSELWRSWGVRPSLVLGHSVGEYAAACVAGVVTLEDGLTLIAERARLMQALPRDGAMVSLLGPRDRVLEAVAVERGAVSVAAVNGPESVVISGRRDAVSRVAARLEGGGFKAKELTVSHAFHSPLMEPMLDAFEKVATGIRYEAPRIGLVSNVTGRPLQAGEIDARYWRRHVREGVQFLAGVQALRERGCDVFLEVGPNPVLLGMGRACVPEGHGIWLPTLRKGRGDWEQALSSLGEAWVRGVPVDWAGFDADYPRRKVAIPTYPFQRREYRLGAAAPGRVAPRRSASEHPILDRPVRSPLIREVLFEGELGLDRLPALADHRVYGEVIAPGAVLLEMACFAAQESLGTSALRDVVIQEALPLPSTASRAVQVVLEPDERGWGVRVISFERGADGSAGDVRVHLAGRARPSEAPPVEASGRLEAARARCPESVDVEPYYDWLAETGIALGPAFRNLVELYRGEGEALGRIRVLEADTPGRWAVDPFLLDAGFSALGASLRSSGITDAYVPLAVESLDRHGPAGPPEWSHARLRGGASSSAGDTISADITLLDAEGRVALEIGGLRFKRVDRAWLERERGHGDTSGWFYRVGWRESAATAELLPTWSPGTIADEVEPGVAARAAEHGLAAYDELMPALDRLCAAYVVAALTRLGQALRPGERVETETLVRALGIQAQHRRLTGRMLEMLQEDGLLRRVVADGPAERAAWDVVAAAPTIDPRDVAREIAARFPGAPPELEFAIRGGERLADVLRGGCDPLQLLFPGGSFALAERLYEQAPPALVVQALARDVVASAVRSLPASRRLRVLEVGAGTGGTTSYVLPTLPRDTAEYAFTDVSPLFLARAREKFAAYPFVRFETLDVERDPREQGFTPGRYDLVLAANVIHATRDLRVSLRHVRDLVAPGGLLVLVEAALPERWLDLSFGLLEGWWRFADTDLRPSYPLLDHQRWVSVLEETGFSEARRVPQHAGGGRILASHAVVVARAREERDRWLVVADRGGVASRLAERVRDRDGACFVVPGEVSGSELERRLRELAPLRGVVHLGGLDEQVNEGSTTTDVAASALRTTGSALDLVQALGRAGLEEPPRVWLVTRGAQPVAPTTDRVAVEQAPLWGFARTVGFEHPELRCTCVDLDPGAGLDQAVEALLAEMGARDDERQVARRGETRLVARLERAALQRPAAPSPQHLVIGRPGVLDDLVLEPVARRAPRRGEVEIEVHATGLNFRDVLNALGMREDRDPLGGECAGQIVAVGEGVEGLAVGDEVVAVCPDCFASFVTTSADLVLRKPARLSMEEAATVPLAFLTAQEALFDVGRLRAGGRVLIHAAAGGVGLAAVQLALGCGADVLATAGSPAKRDYLRGLGVRHVMDSRAAEFGHETREATGGVGVDVVLNSLTGAAIPAGLAALAPGGRFVEIGKAEIWDAARVRALRDDVSYHPLDLAAILAHDPRSRRPKLAGLLEAFDREEVAPLPRTVFPAARAAEAFRYMAQARHTGKIVVTQAVARASRIRSDGTYLVTGGLRGLGLAVADWLVERGARRLVLVGRREPGEHARSRIESMVTRGAAVSVERGDVSQEDFVRGVLERIAASASPLVGVIHSAGVLDDGVLLQQDRDRFARVMAPKVDGSWNLHRHSAGAPLDFFVLFSSGASLLGSAGQSNHAAANAFLDALAHHRRSRGLPAQSINWGVWSQLGAAADRGVDRRAVQQGMGSFTVEQGLHVLARLLEADPPQIGVLPVDWSKLIQSTRIDRLYVSELVAPATEKAAAERPSGPARLALRQRLDAAPPNDRMRLLTEHLRALAMRVLSLDPSDELDIRQPLQQMGLDSLMAVELRNLLAAELALPQGLPATLVFDHPSVAALAEHLGRDVLRLPAAAPEATPVPQGAGTETLGSLLDRIEGLSDADVEKMVGGSSRKDGGR